MTYDLIIVGGGPAGVAAGVYAGRKRLQTLVITESFGGQSVVSADIENWIGEPHITGFDLAKKLEAHLRSYAGIVTVQISELVTGVRRAGGSGESTRMFEVTTNTGKQYQAKTVIIAAGARRKKLNVPGEERLNGKGVAYCSTCDAPIFTGKSVAVVGGGNAGLEAVTDLIPYASSIYLLEYTDTLRGDEVTVDQIRKEKKVSIIVSAEVKEIIGNQLVEGLKYIDRATGKEQTLAVGGVFVEIGSVPNSEMVRGVVELDSGGRILVDPKRGSTSEPGIFAAGDVTDEPYQQNNISAGSGVRAALSAYAYLIEQHRRSSL
jgi:alkyl hydroperoxide reductase subunit F